MTPEQLEHIEGVIIKQNNSGIASITQVINDIKTEMRVFHATTDTKISGITHRQDLANGKVGKLETRVHEMEIDESSRGERWKILIWIGAVIGAGVIGYFLNMV